MTATSTLIDRGTLVSPGRGTDPLRPGRSTRPAAGGGRQRSHSTCQPLTNDQIAAAAQRQRNQLPSFAPLLEELEVAGWSSHRRALAGNFHDWLLVDDGRLLVTVGQVVEPRAADRMEQALVSQGTWATIRASAHAAQDAGDVLSAAARSLWNGPACSRRVAVAVAVLNPIGGQASVAIAGNCLAWRVRAAECEPLLAPQPLLGADPSFAYQSQLVALTLRERLLMIADDSTSRSARLSDSIVGQFGGLDAESHRRMTAAEAVALVRRPIEPRSQTDSHSSASIVAVRRR